MMTMSITTDDTHLSALLARAAERVAASIAEGAAKDEAARIDAARARAGEAVAAWGDEMPVDVRLADATKALAELATTGWMGPSEVTAARAEVLAATVVSVWGDVAEISAWLALSSDDRFLREEPRGLGYGAYTLRNSPSCASSHPLTRAAYAETEAARLAWSAERTAKSMADNDAHNARRDASDEAKRVAEEAASAQRHATLTRVVEAFGDEAMREGWAEGVVDRASAVELLWAQTFGQVELIVSSSPPRWQAQDADILGEGEKLVDVERVSVEAYRIFRALRTNLAARLADPALAAVGTDTEPLYELERVKLTDNYGGDPTTGYTVLATIEIDGVVLSARALLA